jgi:hypothetical protein
MVKSYTTDSSASVSHNPVVFIMTFSGPLFGFNVVMLINIHFHEAITIKLSAKHEKGGAKVPNTFELDAMCNQSNPPAWRHNYLLEMQ